MLSSLLDSTGLILMHSHAKITHTKINSHVKLTKVIIKQESVTFIATKI